jgi:hypothetical protein
MYLVLNLDNSYFALSTFFLELGLFLQTSFILLLTCVSCHPFMHRLRCSTFHTSFFKPKLLMLIVTLIFVACLFPRVPQRGYGDGGSYQGPARNRYRVSKSSETQTSECSVIFIRMFCILLCMSLNKSVVHNSCLLLINNR